MDIFIYIIAGATVGFTVGLTGVGGGSLMTPILLMCGFSAPIAIGTDLLYATITKSTGIWMHARQRTIEWKVAGLLALGSLPAALITIALLLTYFPNSQAYSNVLTGSLGFMLIVTALVLFFGPQLKKRRSSTTTAPPPRKILTVILGAVLGTLVTLSSVGAGAIGTAILMILFPALISVRVVGTDLAHAVPLTLVGGLGHMLLGNVDYLLLLSLLIGSIPAIYLGTKTSERIPDKLLHHLLASILLMIGLRYAFF